MRALLLKPTPGLLILSLTRLLVFAGATRELLIAPCQPTTLQLDNEGVANRASWERDPRSAYWTHVDFDIWTHIREIAQHNWKVEWVRSHPENKVVKSKDPKLQKFYVGPHYKFSIDEELNMKADRIADSA